MAIGNWPDPMVRIKKAGAILGLAGMLAVGGGAVAQVATAESNKAEAVTYYSAGKYICIGTAAYYEVRNYRDFNWFEETVYGWRDDSIRISLTRTPVYDYHCRYGYWL